jgi:arginyl-tRNA synthetase
MNISQLLKQHLQNALTGLVPDPETYAEQVRPAQDPRFGDYQVNCAMSLAKVLGRRPREIAQEIVQRLDRGNILEPPEIAGPGFINLRLSKEWLAAELQRVARDGRLGVEPAAPPRTIVVDFSSPNVAKPMHVGHLRSTIIGDALARLFRFLGHRVITDNHLGDWGTQFGILLYGYKHFRDEAALQKDPVREMVRLYKHVHPLAEDKQNPIAKAVREETARLHSGDPDNVGLWQKMMPWSLAEIEPIYRRLDIHFDHMHGESFYNPMLADVVRSLEEKGVARESNGAIVVGGDDPPAIVRKTDGAFTYTTTDLATIWYRMEHWQPDAMLYVVGAPQALHFKNLFDAARHWGYDRVEMEHIAFGSVLGADGKLIKTREGTPVELSDLLNEAIERAAQVYEQSRSERLARGEDVPQLDAAERRRIAEAVGIGAVKYADLAQNRTSDYMFNWDKMLAMDGNTATYMQYAYVRVRGIFRKGEEAVEPFRRQPPLPYLAEAQERALALQLLRFDEGVRAAVAEYKPNAITAYLWDLAKAYSGFFQHCPVLKADTPVLRQGRLLLCDLTGRIIQQGLQLLGIQTVERM